MPGTEWQQFAMLRLLYSYMIGHPGKKLLFMGAELAQREEWNCKGEISWHLLQYPSHKGVSDCVKDLNHFYQNSPTLWQNDFSWEGYEWVDFSDAENSVVSYLRKGQTTLLFVHNFTPEYRGNYKIALKIGKQLKEVFNTDKACYGGSDKLNASAQIYSDGAIVALAPLATMIFEVIF